MAWKGLRQTRYTAGMAKGSSIEIVCTACGADTLVRREPVYEGFRKVGERCLCAACGHEYVDESEVPFKTVRPMTVFGAEDRPETVEVFRADEKEHSCRYCLHYVVNPFAQRCARHNRFVEATDECPDFSRGKSP